MRIKVGLEGGNKLRELLKRIPAQKTREVRAIVGDIGLKIQNRAKDYLKSFKAIDTGNLRNSTIAEFSETKIEAEIGSTAPYAPYVHFGTRPHFPPPDALKSWARHHGFKSSWPICKVIAKRGLRPRPYLKSAWDDFSGELIISIERVLREGWE